MKTGNWNTTSQMTVIGIAIRTNVVIITVRVAMGCGQFGSRLNGSRMIPVLKTEVISSLSENTILTFVLVGVLLTWFVSSLNTFEPKVL